MSDESVAMLILRLAMEGVPRPDMEGVPRPEMEGVPRPEMEEGVMLRAWKVEGTGGTSGW